MRVHGTGLGFVDRRVLTEIDQHRVGWVDELTKKVMYVGITPWTLALCGVLALVVVLWLRAYRPALAALAALVIASLAADALKEVFDRPRPPSAQALLLVGGPSFPSTHAATTSAVAAALLVATAWPSTRVLRLATLVLTVAVVFIGLCMVYLGAHWLTDVLAGWLLGSCVGGAVAWAARRLWPLRRGTAPRGTPAETR